MAVVVLAAALAGCSDSLASRPPGDATISPSVAASASPGSSLEPSDPSLPATPSGELQPPASPDRETTIAVTIAGDALAAVELTLQVDDRAWRIAPGTRTARVVVTADDASMVGDLNVSVIGPGCRTEARATFGRGSAHTIGFDGAFWAIQEGDSAPATAVVPPSSPWLRGCSLPVMRSDRCLRDPVLDSFAQSLLADIASRDPARVARRMGETFLFVMAQSDVDGTTTPAAATPKLLGRPYLVPSDRISCDTEMPPELAVGGVDLAGRYVGAVRTTGWGTAGGDEAFVYLAQRPTGETYWLGMLYAFGGFRSSATVLCPASPATVPEMVFANAERCGNREVAVRGWLAPPWGIGGLANGIEPAWLGEWATDVVLWSDLPPDPPGCYDDWACIFFFPHVRPGSGVVLGPPARWVELTGHFADPTAAACRFVSSAPWRDPSLVGEDPVAVCRDRFVAESVRTISRP
jgi:hypothetical protein